MRGERKERDGAERWEDRRGQHCSLSGG